MTALLLLVTGCSPSGESAAVPQPEPWEELTGSEDSAGTAATAASGEPALPDLLVISIDTLQLQQVGRYSGLDTTPFLDGLLAEGLVLDRHRSCSSWTYPSFVCALGAGDMTEVGFIPSQGPRGFRHVPDEVTLLYERLAERGYQVGLVSTNTFLSEQMNLTQGLELEELMNEAPAEEVVARGLELLDALDADAPWALHLHFYDPHWPYTVPAGYSAEVDALEPIPWDLGDTGQLKELGDIWPELDAQTQALVLQHLRATYRAELRAMDDQLRGLFEALEARGALADTVVMIFSDHGEQLFEHGALGHRESLYEEENRALAAFWGAGIAPGVWTGGTTHGDLIPTLFELLGWQGPALYGLPAGQGIEDRPLFSMDWADGRTQLALVSGDRKLLYWWSGERQYYELDSDPGELSDRSESADWSDLDELLLRYASMVQRFYFPEVAPPG